MQFPCVGANGVASAQTTMQVLSLRPQPQGDFVGEMTVTVKSNECGQQGGDPDPDGGKPQRRRAAGE